MRRWLWWTLLVPTLAVCGADSPTAPSPARDPKPAPALRVIQLATYDGFGQAVHPDVAVTPAGWGGARFHLVVTPYPFGATQYENPSVYEGNDPVSWSVNAEETNPIARPSAGHLSDPALVFVPESNELWMYYRQAADSNRIWLTRSSDGVRWGTPSVVAIVPNHALISPSVVERAPGTWEMWSVNGGISGCNGASTVVERRTSRDGITWTPPSRVDVPVPISGHSVWHIAVTWIPVERQYWAVFNVKAAGTCATSAVFLATSPDGVKWRTAGAPLLVRGVIPEFQDIVYRACMSYDPVTDVVHFWFSGARRVGSSYAWSIATLSRSRGTAIPQRVAPYVPIPSSVHLIAVPVEPGDVADGPRSP